MGAVGGRVGIQRPAKAASGDRVGSEPPIVGQRRVWVYPAGVLALRRQTPSHSRPSRGPWLFGAGPSTSAS